jgi:hypothetical protein
MLIIIEFPDNNKEYKLPKNDAIQSEFIKNYLENLPKPFKEEKDEMKDSQLMNETIFFKKKKIVIEIPSSFYAGIRTLDLDRFIELWLGTYTIDSCLYTCLNDLLEHDKFNYRAIARLSGALLMNEELNFSKRLNEIMMNEMEKNGTKKN